MEHLGFEELIESGIAYIEWPNRGPQLCAGPHLELTFEYDDQDPSVGRWVILKIQGVSLQEQSEALRLLFSSI